MLHFDRLAHLGSHADRLRQLVDGGDFFVVGGAIRDLLLGIQEEVVDVDLTGAGTPDDWRDRMHVDETRWGRFRTEKYGTMTIVSREIPHTQYEFTPFREESGYADNRHPDEIVWSHDILADSGRRDFTINALYWKELSDQSLVISDQSIVISHQSLVASCQSPVASRSAPVACKDDAHLLRLLKQHGGCVLLDSGTVILQNHELITQAMNATLHLHKLPQVYFSEPSEPSELSHLLLDPQGGLQDLVHRRIRAIGLPTERFTEDALRVLRGLRFVNMINQHLPDEIFENNGFDIEKKTWQAMIACAPLVKEISAERCHAELIKVFSGKNPFGYISLLREVQLLGYLFPALAETIDNRQPTRYHPFDTYVHTILTLWHLQQLCDDPFVRFGLLYHDVGKPAQYEFMDKAIQANPDNPDRTGYVAHPLLGIELAERDFGHLAFSRKQIDQICRYIKRHHRPGEILDSKYETWAKKLRELISEGGYEPTMNLLTLAIADRLGQYNPLQKAAIQGLEHLQAMATTLYEDEGQFTMKNLAVNGHDLMAACAIPAGPALGEALQKAFTRVLEDPTTRNTKEQIVAFLSN